MKRRYRFVQQPSTSTMGRIIMKWGGGLISDKSTLCKPYLDRIQNLSNCVKLLVENGHQVIIVHGAGSFGHIRAREYRLAEGNIDNLEQNQAINLVRKDMDALNHFVMNSLNPLDTSNHPPRNFVRNTGPTFTGKLSQFLEPGVHITFGDVVQCDPPMDFGILSGDDLMLRLAVELPDVSHAIFAMGETAGLMTHPNGELIPTWHRNMHFEGYHSQDVDVTGGIFLKANRASVISEHVEHVWFVDGTQTDRILEIVEEGHSIGTRITPPE